MKKICLFIFITIVLFTGINNVSALNKKTGTCSYTYKSKTVVYQLYYDEDTNKVSSKENFRDSKISVSKVSFTSSTSCPTMYAFYNSAIDTYMFRGDETKGYEKITAKYTKTETSGDETDDELTGAKKTLDCYYDDGSIITVFDNWTATFTAGNKGLAGAGTYTVKSSKKCPNLGSNQYTYIVDDEKYSNIGLESSNDFFDKDDPNTDGPGATVSGCSLIDKDLVDFLHSAFLAIEIAGPVLAIGLGMLDFVKTVMSSDPDKEMKTAEKRFIRRLIAAALLFLIPFVLSFLMDIINDRTISDDPFCNVTTGESS